MALSSGHMLDWPIALIKANYAKFQSKELKRVPCI